MQDLLVMSLARQACKISSVEKKARPFKEKGAKLRGARKAVGLTQQGVVDAIYPGQEKKGQVYQNWELGLHEPPSDIWGDLSKVLKTNVRDVYVPPAAGEPEERPQLDLHGVPGDKQSRIIAAFEWMNPDQQDEILKAAEAYALANQNTIRRFGHRITNASDKRVERAYGLPPKGDKK